MALDVKYYLSEVKHRTLRTYRMVQGKALHIGLRTAMGAGAASVASDLSYPFREAINIAQPAGIGTAVTQASLTTGEILLSSTGGLISIGIGAGVNGYLNHLDHKHYQQQLCALYRPQIAAMTGKDLENVGVEDLKTVAANNPTLKNELTRNDKYRTVKNVAAVVGTVVAFAAVFAAITFTPLGGLAVAAAAQGIFSGAGMAFAALAGGIGYATLHSARKSVVALGKSLFGLDKPSVGDQIRTISKQHRKEITITPVQVMDVFVSANPPLAEEIEGRHQKKYTNMSLEEKKNVSHEYADSLHAADIAKAINDGKISAFEMSFLAHGQFSGAYPEVPWHEKVMGRAQEKFDVLREDALEKLHNWKQERAQSKLQDDVAEALEEGKPLPKDAQRMGWRSMIDNQRAAIKTAAGVGRS